MRRSAALLSSLFLVVGGTLVCGTASASADTVTGELVQSGIPSADLCLNAASDQQLVVSTCDFTQASQNWTAKQVSEETGDSGEVFQVVNIKSGSCLNSDASGDVFLSACGTSPSESWSGDEQLVNQATGLCADVRSDDTVYAAPCATFGTVRSQEWFWGGWA